MLVYGAHQPKYLSDSDVIKYYKHLGLQNEIYRIKDYSEINRKQYRYLGNSLPETLIFNSRGQLTKFEISCSSKLDSIAELSLHEIDNMSLEGNSIKDFIDDTYVINNLNKEDTAFLKMPLYVIKFAEFVGLLNKDNVPGMVERLSRRKDVQYILLNMDYTVDK